MRVRITYTVEVDDDYRRQINDHYGRPGLASRDDIKSWYRSFGESMDDDLAAGWVGDDGERPSRPAFDDDDADLA